MALRSSSIFNSCLYFLAASFALATGSFAIAQQPAPPPQTLPGTTDAAHEFLPPSSLEGSSVFVDSQSQDGLFPSDRAFPGFIGFLSNPTRNFDPRSLTQLWPLFVSEWTDSFRPLPGGDIQAYGAGISVALTDRLCAGLSNGGYAVGHYNQEREGWANLGGFVQYTLVRDVCDQFLLTGGLIWEAPSGSKDIFQGSGPAYLAPYLTAGKEFGDYHVLVTAGYNFAAGSALVTTNSFYTNLHFDPGRTHQTPPQLLRGP
ncbi:MAG TPA: hypothetical protein VK395_18260 [Gemmataceae bacterium]|nr:hypothetical protein [Gemmataceae bacterium]